jgi:hypothetical protein
MGRRGGEVPALRQHYGVIYGYGEHVSALLFTRMLLILSSEGAFKQAYSCVWCPRWLSHVIDQFRIRLN